MKHVALLVVAACHSATAPTPVTAPPPSPERAKIEALAEAEIAAHHAVGMTIAVARGDQLVVANGYGFADAARRVPATIDTVYRIGSVTKQFTAVAILQLVEQGKLALTDDVRKYVPAYPAHDPAITIDQLLTHTSGIPTYTDGDWIDAGQHPLTHAQVLARFATKPLEFAPGTAWSYSNSNYYLLGLVIERVTGSSYGDAVRERVLVPAGMTHSGACDSPQLAHGYATAEGPVDAIPFDNGPPFAAGALCSTALDLVAWQRALEHGVVLSPASLAKMRTSAVLSTGKPAGYGYGVFVAEREGHPRIEHGGAINGFISELSRYPKDDVTVVVLANTEGRTPSKVEAQISTVVLGLSPVPVRQGKPLAEAERVAYTGTFDLEMDGQHVDVRVFTDGDKLRTQLHGQPAITMLYQGERTFTLDMDEPVKIVFAADLARFTIFQHGHEVEVKRVAAETVNTGKPLPAAERAAYVGKYDLEMHGQHVAVRVFVEGDALRSQIQGQPPVTMLYQG
ncbi:MAG: serine hydrolase domain-containing protein, partial [Kofleriaceae bacterium]